MTTAKDAKAVSAHRLRKLFSGLAALELIV